jgi:hypothetical protein
MASISRMMKPRSAPVECLSTSGSAASVLSSIGGNSVSDTYLSSSISLFGSPGDESSVSRDEQEIDMADVPPRPIILRKVKPLYT